MASKISAGLLLYRFSKGQLQILLAHPGGPYWKSKDLGAWTIPKGEADADEAVYAAARREFMEETGYDPRGIPVPLGSIRQTSGKVVWAWALEEDWGDHQLVSTPFEMPWPPKSPTIQSFPEIDRAEWFNLDIAREKILKAQLPFLDRLEKITGTQSDHQNVDPA